MRLDLRFSDRPIESLWCQAVAAMVFQDPLMEGEILCGLDEKLGGFLGKLQQRGFWTGERGETLLIASQGAIGADKILIKGLGKRTDCNAALLSHYAKEVGEAFVRMGITEFGIHIPVGGGLENDYLSRLETCAYHLPEPYLRAHQDRSDFLLKIIFSVERCTAYMMKILTQRLRGHFAPTVDFSVVVSLEGEN